MTSRARLSTTPSPMPGNASLLLHSATSCYLPSKSTGSKGLPVAVSTFPFVHAYRSCGPASCNLVGFESGKMIGRWTSAAIACTISFVNVFGLVLVPMST